MQTSRVPLRRLRRSVLMAAGVVLWMGVTPGAQAMSFEDALIGAYTTNPEIEAQRAFVRSVDEGVAQAKAGWRPNVQVQGDITRNLSSSPAGTSRDFQGNERPDIYTTSRSVSLSVAQPVWRGWRTFNQVDQAEARVLAQRAQLSVVEQGVLVEAATAYVDVLRAMATVNLNRNNEQVLSRQLEAAQDRFRVGEITRTDVAQAEARLAGATAARLQAEGTLQAVRATFERVVGAEPGRLSDPPPVDRLLPPSLEETVALARENNPAVISAGFTARASEFNVDVVRGELLPELTLNAQGTRSLDGGSRDSQSNNVSIGARLTVPLYQGGQVYARLREAKQLKSQARLQVAQATREAVEAARSGWENLQAARAAIRSFVAQIDAARIALDGVEREAQVGSRTVLDVLDAEQELLDARVELVGAQRNELVITFQLLSAMGLMTAEGLGLGTQTYNPAAYLDSVRNRLFGAEIEELPGGAF